MSERIVTVYYQYKNVRKVLIAFYINCFYRDYARNLDVFSSRDRLRFGIGKMDITENVPSYEPESL